MSEALTIGAPHISETVGDACAAYREMIDNWTLVNDLLGGTEAMRAAGERWLPKEEDEEDEEYEKRIGRTFLFNAFKKSARMLVGKPFTKPLVYEDVDKTLEPIVQDVDANGMHMDIFARDLFHDQVTKGIAHYLVSYPPVPNADELSKLDEKQLNIRPYWQRIAPENIIGWRTQKIGGKDVLVQLRIRQFAIEEVDEFTETEVEEIMVIEPTRWMTYRLNTSAEKEAERKKWKLHESGENTLGKIPLVTIYGERTGFMTCRPPLLDLAHLNVLHWQSDSDQRNILHVARVPLLFAKGFVTDNKTTKHIVVGGNRYVEVESPSADMKYVEITGASITAGKADIDEIKLNMMMMGAEPLAKKPATMTATQRVLDGIESDSDLGAMCRNLKDGIELGMLLTAEWLKVKLAKQPVVKINTDFGITARDAQDANVLLQACVQGKLSLKALLTEWKRRGMLDQETDVDELIDEINEDAPKLDPNDPSYQEMLKAMQDGNNGAGAE